ncbi:hypothetical protein F0U62_13675 [Cystobacter fuscus]|uniref:hypothetical protein n=1 Tax=Cystobacter fuscus TaxID=43 RepID=UPI002B2A0DA2|nr:hypothetical protein F0U62_13675 [Cystobacter fuscus]
MSIEDDDSAIQNILGVAMGQSRPHKNLTYEAFSDAIARRDKTSLLLGASKILWALWKGEVFPEGRKNDYYIGRAYLGRISAIAAGVCQATSDRVAVTEDELLELAGEFLGVTESLSDLAFFNQEELPRFTKALQNDENFKSHIPPPEIIRGHAGRLTLIRTLRSQWDFKSVDLKGVLRTWILAQRLDEKYGRGLLDRLRRAMNIELRDQLRAGFAILATGDNKTPGLISEQSLLVDADVARTLNLDTDALAFVTNRVSRDCTGFTDWHRSVLSDFPEPYRKYAPHPLVSLPLIQLDASFRGWPTSVKGYLCPSPPHLLWRIQSSCIDAICGLAPEQGKDPRADLGDCLSDYIFDFLALSADVREG